MKKIENRWLGRDGYNCYGCCPTNAHGLKMEFWEDGDSVVSHWHPTPEFQGWTDTLHGGIQAALADEIAGWAVIHFVGANAVTAKMEMHYHKPVLTTDDHLTLRARIAARRGPLVVVDVTLFDVADEECTTATLSYFIDKSKEGI